jgi:teichuronic acid exporter
MIAPLRRVLGSNLLLSGISAAATTLIPLLIFVYLARRLDAPSVGVVIYAVTVLEMLKVLCPLGLYEALLSSAEYELASPVVGGLLAASAAAAMLLFLAVILVSAQLMPTLSAGLGFALAVGFKLPFDILVLHPQAALVKSLRVRALAQRGLAANGGAALLGIACAHLLDPMTGLVLYYVAQSLITWGMTVADPGARETMRWQFDSAVARRLIPVAWPASQVRSLGAINNYADQFVTGVVLGATDLARYNLGKRFEVAQFGLAQSLIGMLYQPRFAQRDPAEVTARHFGDALFVITLSCGVPSLLLAANADRLIPLLFGPQWQEAAPIAAALAIGGFARAFGSVHGAYQSLRGGNGDVRNRAVASALSGLLLLPVAQFGGLAVVAILVAAKNVAIALWGAFSVRALAGRAVYLRDVAPPLAAALVGAIGTRALCTTYPPFAAHAWAELIISCLAGGAAALAVASKRLQLLAAPAHA